MIKMANCMNVSRYLYFIAKKEINSSTHKKRIKKRKLNLKAQKNKIIEITIT